MTEYKMYNWSIMDYPSLIPLSDVTATVYLEKQQQQQQTNNSKPKLKTEQ